MEQALAHETDSVGKALWRAALGQLYEGADGYRRWGSEDYEGNEQKAHDYFTSSLDQLELLGKARVKDYLPLFTPGAESRHYDDDLLHVLYRTAMDSRTLKTTEKQVLRQRVLAYYQAQGNQAATLLLNLEALEAERSGRRIKGRLEECAYFGQLQKL
ncbi:MAG: hypothetical protein Q4P78_09530, partial [Rothia sp. (in: high G+C Gram-positive bacteria)]|nr:hypothetical protein [Rothia sp. (in: high G+C Gram-positive bacteria)]